MIFVHIDNTTSRNVIGYECGTRALFDTRHPGDPLWMFFDGERIRARVHFDQFLRTPTDYKVDDKGFIRRKT